MFEPGPGSRSTSYGASGTGEPKRVRGASMIGEPGAETGTRGGELLEIYPPHWFGHEITQRMAHTGDPRHETLRSVLPAPTQRYLRTPQDAIMFTLPLSDLVCGDGRALIAFATGRDRPAYRDGAGRQRVGRRRFRNMQGGAQGADGRRFRRSRE